MSSGRRAYDILRGYVGTEWERIKGVERDLAERELWGTKPLPTSFYNTPATQTPETPAAAKAEPRAPQDPKAYARRLLGVSETSPFSEIRKAFARLNKRSDPANFPAGSAEATQALEIQKKVAWAYSVLTEDMDSTERRFGSLELE